MAISRARTGCWTCRSRRIKCDETRPVCRRCERLKIACGYGIRLIWHEESMARGVCHGRSRKTFCSPRPRVRAQSDTKPGPASWMFLNTSTTDIELYLDPSIHQKKPFQIFSSLSTAPAALLPTDPHLLSFFERTICSSSTLIDNAHCNPYRYLILPMALASTGLYHATLAIAANTLRLSNPAYRVPALEHHSRAVASLRRLLSQDEWSARELDEMVGLVLMLCWFDISDNSCPTWVSHLTGYQNLLELRARQQKNRSAHSEQLSGFLNRYFAFHLVLARTAFRVDEAVRPLDLIQPPNDNDDDIQEDMIDTYMGLSPSLLSLINQVAGLAWDSTSGENTASYMLLEEQLETLQQVPPREGISETECMAIAEANRLGAVLLLHEVAAMSGQTLLNPEGRSRCVGEILGLILSKRSNMMRTAVLPLWPLFLAGCCASTDEERVLAMRLFEELEGIRRFGVCLLMQ
ncbi:fungal-specific transcription factor domain-containing protein [Aspergillus unguis]